MESSSNAISQFDALLASSEFLFVVYYRGHWCPFCRAYLTALAKIQPSIIEHSGKTLIVTAEPANFLPETLKSTGYTGDAIVDEENVLLKELKNKGWVDVAVTEKKGYEHGMAQPAVLVVKKGGEVLESWAIVPSMMNLGGAKDRPEVAQIWDNVQAKLKGGEKVHGSYKLSSFWSLITGKHLVRGLVPIRREDYQLTCISGGWDPESAPPVFTAKNVKSQIDQAFPNIDLTLKTAGGKGMSQVFRINSYHPNSSLEAMSAMKANLEKWFPDHRPTWTAVGVEKLAFREMLVEIEAAAYDPQKAKLPECCRQNVYCKDMECT